MARATWSGAGRTTEATTPSLTLIGGTVAYQFALWRIQGLVLAMTASGGRELRWILDEQTRAGGDSEQGGGSDA